MTGRLIDAMARARPKLCPYLHLPVQSGSDRVLLAMRRGYDRAGYLQRIDALRRAMPELRFGTDVIVGFPSETDADFQETLSLLEHVGFENVFAYTYSTRPGTAALELGDPFTEERKLERLHALHARQNMAQLDSMRRWVGQDVTVLVEGRSKRDATRWTGRTPENRLVHFPGEARPGTLHTVRVTDATAFCLLAEGESGAA
jgi:tRNA-2-methylthio-N6-dimethylallyladenosine synthase